MLNLFYLQFLLSTSVFFGLFILAVFLAFYIPGKVILGNYLEKLHNIFLTIVISLIIGIVLWGYQGVILGYLEMRSLSYVYLACFFFIWIRRQGFHKFLLLNLINLKINKKIFRIKNNLSRNKSNLLLVLIFLFGIFGQVQQFLITGIPFPDGIRVFTVASDDAFWNTSLIAQIARRFPPFEPGLVNVQVHNYHYWSSLVIAELVRVFHLPLLQTQFQFMYLFMSFLIGAIAYVLGKQLKFSSVGLALIVYLQYFSSDVIYLLTIFSRRYLEFGVHPLEDGTMFLENPPRAFSFVITLGGLSLLALWIKSRSVRLGLITSLVFGSIIGFKVNTGVLVIAGLGGLSLYFLLKRDWKMLFVPLITLIISLLVYLPVNSGSGIPIFSPFEKTREFIVQEKLKLSSFELARRIYHDHNNVLQEWRMDISMFMIFLLAQFGIRNIGWISVRASIRQLGLPFSIFLYTGIITTTLLGTFFLQPVAPADIFNFFLVASLFLSILSSLSLSNWLARVSPAIKVLIIVVIVVATLPRWIYKTNSVKYYFTATSPNIHATELDAMKFLEEKTGINDVILVLNQGQWDSMYPYVSIFSQRDMFLSGMTILGRHGISYKDREIVSKTILENKNNDVIKRLLKKNNIRILYFYGYSAWADKKSSFLKKIFSNEQITIYRFIEDK